LEKLVVVGGVAAGPTAAARARRCCPDACIKIFNEGRYVSYAGCSLPYFLGGVTTGSSPDDLVVRTPEEFRSRNDIEVLTRHRVEEIDTGGRRAFVRDLDSDRSFEQEYTVLLIATGASPFVPTLEGKNLEGAFVLRTLEDAIRIKRFLESARPRKAVIAGAGPIGMEMCESFRAMNMDVTLVEMAEQVMPSLDPELAEVISGRLQSEGVRLALGERLESIEGNSGDRVTGVVTSGGRYEADLCLISLGIRPNTDLAGSMGVELGSGGAVKIDGFMRTSVEGVFAAGDCAVTRNLLTGGDDWFPLGSTARKHGRLAADNMLGSSEEFPGVLGTSIVKSFDLTMGRTGLDREQARDAGFDPESVIITSKTVPAYYPGGGTVHLKVVVDRGSGRVLGGQVTGDLSGGADRRLDHVAVAITGGLSVESLQYLDLAYAPPYSQPMDMPLIAGNVLSRKLKGMPCACDGEGLE
jgi:NADPH-dependent 2,4-dienoyl-CoA reductase/sulfur reductase-like enzyme